MKLFQEYLEEYQPGRSVFYSNFGFATYTIGGEECYIDQIYVRPDKRKTGEAANMADAIVEIAKDLGCKYLTGSVSTDQKNEKRQTTSTKVLLAYGFQVLFADKNMIWFKKEI